MREIILIAVLLIAGCSTIVNENPYRGVPSAKLKYISGKELCRVTNNPHYKDDINVVIELLRRGYKDASESEVYCIDTLGLKPGTSDYAYCRIQRDQFNYQVESTERALRMQSWANYEASRPRSVDVTIHETPHFIVPNF